MADTTARTLRLLSLLQRRRYWPGPDLAERLQISERTLRRDIERLRDLGYAVEADRGVDGGYRLGGASGDAMLLLDNDEATALAAALHVAAAGATELAEASLGALTKVLSILGPSQRQRVDAMGVATSFGTAPSEASPQLVVLDIVAAACRDQVRLCFDYLDATGTATTRYVEPCQIVALESRWYLVAFDTDRAAWRTFRLDRMTDAMAARNSFPPRPAPAKDLYQYVRFNMSELVSTFRISMEIDLPAEDVRREYGTWVEVEALRTGGCRLTMETASFEWPTHIAVTLLAPIAAIEPPEFAQHLSRVARLLASGVP